MTMKIVFAGLLIGICLIGLRKDMKKFKNEEKEDEEKNPQLILLTLLPVIGLLIFSIGWIIFQVIVLHNIGITFIIVGFTFLAITQWKSGGVRKNLKSLFLIMMMAVIYSIYYY